MPSLIDHTYLISARMRNFSFDEMTKFSKGASDKKSHPVLTIPYVWRVTHEYINEGLKQGRNSLVNPWATSNQRT